MFEAGRHALGNAAYGGNNLNRGLDVLYRSANQISQHPLTIDDNNSRWPDGIPG
jgi:hypothetical protein